jgi:hypothetical protein
MELKRLAPVAVLFLTAIVWSASGWTQANPGRRSQEL